MSTALVYPVGLPGPTAAPFQPAERRLLSSLPGPRQSRPMQRDRKASQALDFIFTHAEVAIFLAWLDVDLVRAGAWFAAEWPQPQGGVGVRRFVGEPSYPTYYPNVGWHVSAEVEVMGRGEVPQIADMCDLVLRGPPGMTLRLQMLFDGDFEDSSGNYSDFVGPGSTITTEIKRCGAGALSLPLYSSYVRQSGPTGVGFAMPGDFKIASVVHPTVLDSGTGASCIFSQRNVTDPFATDLIALGIGEDGMFLRIGGIELHGDGGAGTFALDEWALASVERVEGNVRFKKNGVQIGATQTSGYPNAANAYLSIGYEPYVYQKSMIGYVDSLSVWTAT